MKKHRIREYSPAWWISGFMMTGIFVFVMSLPSTIESLMGWM